MALNQKSRNSHAATFRCASTFIYQTAEADLEEERPSLPDEVALGVSYAAIDAYLQGADVAEADAERIESWYAKTEHKRRLPITVFDDFWRAPYQS